MATLSVLGTHEQDAYLFWDMFWLFSSMHLCTNFLNFPCCFTLWKSSVTFEIVVLLCACVPGMTAQVFCYKCLERCKQILWKHLSTCICRNVYFKQMVVDYSLLPGFWKSRFCTSLIVQSHCLPTSNISIKFCRERLNYSYLKETVV